MRENNNRIMKITNEEGLVLINDNENEVNNNYYYNFN